MRRTQYVKRSVSSLGPTISPDLTWCTRPGSDWFKAASQSAFKPPQADLPKSDQPEASKEAAREVRADRLLICAYAFDRGASEQASSENEREHTFSVDGQRTVGRLRVLNTRINVDLMMDDDLKNTGVGNLFTVFGELDITVTEQDDETVTVTINGLDVYDPNKGTVRSSDPKDIACWFIDTNYSGDAFYVRHAYFTGGASDPYSALKKALRAEINEEAWAALYRTESLPFVPPETGKIAVKAINHFGERALKVFAL